MKIFEYIFLVLIPFVLVLPLVGYYIKRRFNKLGFKLKSNPLFTVTSFSNFFKEASEVNRTSQDKLIGKLILIHNIWWFVIVIVFLFMFFMY